jgi:hypothetical protein
VIVHMSVHTPKSGKEQEPIDSMRAAVADDPFDEWEAVEVEGFFLEEE